MYGKKIWFYFLLLLILPLIGCGEESQPPVHIDLETTTGLEELVYPQAPSFMLPDLNGNSVSLSDFQGKLVLLDFFATWCVPCRVEIPGFIELYQKYKSRGLVVVGIATDVEGLEVVKPYAKELQIDYPVVIGDIEVVKAYGVPGLPTNLIIDQQGGIRFQYVGVQPKEVFEREILGILNK